MSVELDFGAVLSQWPFLLTGVLIGPHGFSLIHATHEVDILAEIGLGRCLHAEALPAERNFIEIKLKDLFFFQHAFDAAGDDHFLDLALQGARGVEFQWNARVFGKGRANGALVALFRLTTPVPHHNFARRRFGATGKEDSWTSTNLRLPCGMQEAAWVGWAAGVLRASASDIWMGGCESWR